MFRKKLEDWNVVDALSDDEDWNIVQDGDKSVISCAVESITGTVEPSLLVKFAARGGLSIVIAHLGLVIVLIFGSFYDIIINSGSTSSNALSTVTSSGPTTDSTLSPNAKSSEFKIEFLSATNRSASDEFENHFKQKSKFTNSKFSKMAESEFEFWRMKESKNAKCDKYSSSTNDEDARYDISNTTTRNHYRLNSDNLETDSEASEFKDHSKKDFSSFRMRYLRDWVRRLIIANERRRHESGEIHHHGTTNINTSSNPTSFLNYNLSLSNSSYYETSNRKKRSVTKIHYRDNSCQVGICFPETEAEASEEKLFFDAGSSSAHSNTTAISSTTDSKSMYKNGPNFLTTSNMNLDNKNLSLVHLRYPNSIIDIGKILKQRSVSRTTSILSDVLLSNFVNTFAQPIPEPFKFSNKGRQFMHDLKKMDQTASIVKKSYTSFQVPRANVQTRIHQNRTVEYYLQKRRTFTTNNFAYDRMVKFHNFNEKNLNARRQRSKKVEALFDLPAKASSDSEYFNNTSLNQKCPNTKRNFTEYFLLRSDETRSWHKKFNNNALNHVLYPSPKYDSSSMTKYNRKLSHKKFDNSKTYNLNLDTFNFNVYDSVSKILEQNKNNWNSSHKESVRHSRQQNDFMRHYHSATSAFGYNNKINRRNTNLSNTMQYRFLDYQDNKRINYAKRVAYSQKIREEFMSNNFMNMNFTRTTPSLEFDPYKMSSKSLTQTAAKLKEQESQSVSVELKKASRNLREAKAFRNWLYSTTELYSNITSKGQSPKNFNKRIDSNFTMSSNNLNNQTIAFDLKSQKLLNQSKRTIISQDKFFLKRPEFKVTATTRAAKFDKLNEFLNIIDSKRQLQEFRAHMCRPFNNLKSSGRNSMSTYRYPSMYSTSPYQMSAFSGTPNDICYNYKDDLSFDHKLEQTSNQIQIQNLNDNFNISQKIYRTFRSESIQKQSVSSKLHQTVYKNSTVSQWSVSNSNTLSKYSMSLLKLPLPETSVASSTSVAQWLAHLGRRFHTLLFPGNFTIEMIGNVRLNCIEEKKVKKNVVKMLYNVKSISDMVRKITEAGRKSFYENLKLEEKCRTLNLFNITSSSKFESKSETKNQNLPKICPNYEFNVPSAHMFQNLPPEMQRELDLPPLLPMPSDYYLSKSVNSGSSRFNLRNFNKKFNLRSSSSKCTMNNFHDQSPKWLAVIPSQYQYETGSMWQSLKRTRTQSRRNLHRARENYMRVTQNNARKQGSYLANTCFDKTNSNTKSSRKLNDTKWDLRNSEEMSYEDQFHYESYDLNFITVNSTVNVNDDCDLCDSSSDYDNSTTIIPESEKSNSNYMSFALVLRSFKDDQNDLNYLTKPSKTSDSSYIFLDPTFQMMTRGWEYAHKVNAMNKKVNYDRMRASHRAITKAISCKRRKGRGC